MIRLPPYLRVIIPAYNAAGTLPVLLERLRMYMHSSQIIVVDDGSSDETARLAEASGVWLCRHDRNSGKGAALKTGIREALKGQDVRSVVTMDADGQHDPEDLGNMVVAWQRTGADLLLGDRTIRGSAMPVHRRASNVLTSLLVSARIGQHVPDSQCGYRLLSRRLAERIVPESDGFEAETEWLLRASGGGYRICSVPVRTVYHGETSHMKNWVTIKAFIRVLVREYPWAG